MTLRTACGCLEDAGGHRRPQRAKRAFTAPAARGNRGHHRQLLLVCPQAGCLPLPQGLVALVSTGNRLEQGLQGHREGTKLPIGPSGDQPAGLIRLTRDPGSDIDGAWSPDGRQVACAAQTNGTWDIWVAADDGSRGYRLTHDARMETKPLWSPDGKKMALPAETVANASGEDRVSCLAVVSDA